ncbi:NADPH-dependent oxidoreductase [Bdellovibrio bacteriovorus]|uniref:NADPH-dependent oxidoreductase n=1 Tax=Bdellovibrio bacteriovorus TaxID=959 RepID=A0A150WTF4_BDEBC|nr:NADPH-dependent oxidoreductase [Bdellovibrio bacteriovorus]
MGAEGILDAINSHSSIRSYKKDLVPEGMLQRILHAASRASSSGNMQAYSVIVTSEQKIKEDLFDSHFRQSMVLEAPLLLTFCADFHRMRRWLKLRGAPDNFDNFMSFMIASIDAILASQNAALAAEAEGLGICYMGTTLANCDDIAKVLNCPEGVVPVVGFSMGYPNEKPELRDRLPLEHLVHRERYENKTDLQILQAYQNREIEGWKRYLSNPQLRRRIEESGVENLAQVYTKLKYTRESHEVYSDTIRRCLQRQGIQI